MKYNLFIGRYSPFHKGHQTIIDSFVKNGKPVCIAVRASEEDHSLADRLDMIHEYYRAEIGTGMVKVMAIPDIDQVCIGRDVGYGIVEVPEDIERISGTAIRNGEMDRDGNEQLIVEDYCI